MPPARKNVYPCNVVAETASKKARPCHVVNLQDLCVSPNDNDKFHLMLKINKFSPDEISIKRSGSTLTVESKTKDELREGGGASEPTARSYEIPKGGYNEELGAQISTDGLLAIRGPGMNRMPGRVIPIHLDNLHQMKPGTMIRLNAMTGWNGESPVKFASFSTDNGVEQSSQDKPKDKESDSAKSNDEKMMERVKLTVANSDQGMDIPGDNSENVIEGVQPDESA